MGNKARGCGQEPNIARGDHTAIFGREPHPCALFPVVHEQTVHSTDLVYESRVSMGKKGNDSSITMSKTL